MAKKIANKKIELTGSGVTLEQAATVARGEAKVSVGSSALKAMKASRSYLEAQVKKGKVMYGVNTGFGALSSVHISDEDIAQLQRNLIRSHSSGVGAPFSREETRAILFLRANALSRGHSGIRPEAVAKILEFLEKDILPVVPSQGSLGASGDLAPLSHLALSLIGEGECWAQDSKGNWVPRPTSEVLKVKKVKPLDLQFKEGLSLINGCQVMTAVGLLSAERARDLILLADIAGAMSLEALRGSRDPFNPLFASTRPHPGEKETSANLLKILGKTSKIAESHADCDRVQDVYSLRCMPAVHGAVKNTFRRAVETLETEANSSTDNPLVFAKEGKVLSCGNFHGEPVAFQLDFLGIAMCELGNISQCRVSRLINPSFSHLPAFLTPNSGLNSGLMVVEYAAAAVVSENKVYAHPGSVDSIPTSVDKEDHVSMGMTSAKKLKLIVENVSQILAIEILAAMQALSLLKPLKPAAGVLAAYEFLAKDIPVAKTDRVFADDIKKIKAHIDSGELLKHVLKATGPLEI